MRITTLCVAGSARDVFIFFYEWRELPFPSCFSRLPSCVSTRVGQQGKDGRQDDFPLYAEQDRGLRLVSSFCSNTSSPPTLPRKSVTMIPTSHRKVVLISLDNSLLMVTISLFYRIYFTAHEIYFLAHDIHFPLMVFISLLMASMRFKISR